MRRSWCVLRLHNVCEEWSLFVTWWSCDGVVRTLCVWRQVQILRQGETHLDLRCKRMTRRAVVSVSETENAHTRARTRRMLDLCDVTSPTRKEQMPVVHFVLRPEKWKQ